MRFSFICVILISCLELYAADSLEQRQAFWVVRHALRNEAEIEKIISIAVENNITDIFVQIRALGQVYYSSIIENRAENISESYDPLKIIIEKARPFNIKIHAWINMFYIWSGSHEPADKRHPFHKFHENLLSNGKIPDYKALRSAGVEGYYIDPQNIQVQNYLLNLLLEVVDSYKVSGIHLDYFRYPGVTFSFTPENRTTFRIKNFFDPLEVFGTPALYADERGYEVFQYADKTYRTELTDELSAYLKRISMRLKDINVNNELSVAVKPDPVLAKLRYFQGWQDWVKNDYCDFVVIMNYKTDYREFNNILLQVAEMDKKEKIMVGISTFNQSAESVNNRLHIVRDHQFAGFSLFSYNHLIENKKYLSKLSLKN